MLGNHVELKTINLINSGFRLCSSTEVSYVHEKIEQNGHRRGPYSL